MKQAKKSQTFKEYNELGMFSSSQYVLIFIIFCEITAELREMVLKENQ